MLCPECRTENPDTSKFCFKCGAKLGQPATEPAVRAPEVRKGGVGGRVVAIAGLLALLVLIAAAGIFLLRRPESTPSESGVSQQATRVDEPSGRPTTAPAKTPLPEPPPEDPLVYPGAQVLDISSVEWDELAPPIGIMGEPEALLQHRAWRTQDLARKIVAYYDQAMFDANWQSRQAGWESDGGWTYNRFRKGDDELSVGIIDNLPSALIAHFPDIGLEPGDTLIIMSIGNPLNAYLAHGRELLQAGDWEAAKNYAERVASSRLQAGVGMDDPYVQDAVTLLAEALRQMTPVDAARLWFSGSVTADVFGPEKTEALYLMRRLGLVREYEGGIIDSYTPTGEWQEISNDETTAVLELVGVAQAKMSNRLIPEAEVESFDYRLQLTLQRDEEGIWEVDEDAGFVVGGGATEQPVEQPAVRRARQPAGDNVPIGDNPRLALPDLAATNYIYDFGKVPPDEIVEANITIKNKGTKPLVIKSVRASCGCVAANIGEDTISPGWSTQLRVTYDPTYNNDAGKQITRQIIIESNDPAAPVVEFTIRAEVETESSGSSGRNDELTEEDATGLAASDVMQSPCFVINLLEFQKNVVRVDFRLAKKVNIDGPHPQLAIEGLNARCGNAYNFGRLEPTEIGQQRLTFKNVGDVPLTVTGLYTSCGCTAAQIEGHEVSHNGVLSPPLVLQPSETKEFVLALDASQIEDRDEPSIVQVFSDDPRGIPFGELWPFPGQDRELRFAVLAQAVLPSGFAGIPSEQTNEGDPALGSPNAPVTIVEYSDYQCPHCATFSQNTLPEIIKYVTTGQVRYVHKNAAILGEESQWAAQAALCAADQGRFWKYHEVLFQKQSGQNQGAFSRDNLRQFAADLGLDTTAFNQCLDQNKYTQKVVQETAEAKQRGVRGTPSFFVNDELVEDNVPFSQMKDIIEGEST